MIKNFANIKVLLWDVDGTFFQITPELNQKVKQNTYQTLAKHLGCDLDTAKIKFENKYQSF